MPDDAQDWQPKPPRSGATPSDAALPDAALPDATRRFDPIAPDADAADATRRSDPADDEEALRWSGDDDATERFSPAVAHPKQGRDAATGSALLIVYGAFGGIYLLMTIGWIATALRFLTTTNDPLQEFMQRVSTILAVLAPGAWFALAIWLTRGKPAWVRIVCLTIGILIVAPWPLISGSLG
jgi:hypothetical protein